jgi:hypothetical protein
VSRRFNAIDRPNPVPLPTSLVVKKGSKARSATSRLIPTPVSRIDTSTQSRPATSWRFIADVRGFYQQRAALRHRVARRVGAGAVVADFATKCAHTGRADFLVGLIVFMVLTVRTLLILGFGLRSRVPCLHRRIRSRDSSA